MSEDLYKILGVQPNASIGNIKMKYRMLSRKYKAGKSTDGEEKLKELNAAYEILSNKQKRAEFDAKNTVSANNKKTAAKEVSQTHKKQNSSEFKSIYKEPKVFVGGKETAVAIVAVMITAVLVLIYVATRV